MSNTERYRGHRRVISSVSDQTATDSDVIRYYDLKVKLSLYPHMRNVWFNGVEQCPATQLMNSFHTCGNNEGIRKQVKQELPELEERFRIHQIELNKKLEIEKQIQNDRLNAFILECKTYRINPKTYHGSYKGHDQLVIELEQAKSAEKRREIRKQSLGLKHNNKEKETREFEIRFQKEEKEKRYQEFKRKKEKSKYTDAEAIPIAVAVPLLVVENVA
jgi:hypothetical protein